MTYIALITTLVGLLTTLVVACRKLYSQAKALFNTVRANKVVIGILHCSVPEVLRKYPIYSSDKRSFRQAILSPGEIVLVNVRTLSWALRHCDWVAHAGHDEKEIDPNDEKQWQVIIERSST